MKMHFNDLFNYDNGLVTPKVHIHLNGITKVPGETIENGSSVGGLNMKPYIDRYLDVELENGVHVIRGIIE